MGNGRHIPRSQTEDSRNPDNSEPIRVEEFNQPVPGKAANDSIKAEVSIKPENDSEPIRVEEQDPCTFGKTAGDFGNPEDISELVDQSGGRTEDHTQTVSGKPADDSIKADDDSVPDKIHPAKITPVHAGVDILPEDAKSGNDSKIFQNEQDPQDGRNIDEATEEVRASHAVKHAKPDDHHGSSSVQVDDNNVQPESRNRRPEPQKVTPDDQNAAIDENIAKHGQMKLGQNGEQVTLVSEPQTSEEQNAAIDVEGTVENGQMKLNQTGADVTKLSDVKPKKDKPKKRKNKRATLSVGERLLYGDLSVTLPQSTRIVRVFLSSTFTGEYPFNIS